MTQSNPVFRLTLLATGGTIEKTYDAHAGQLTLDVPVIESLLEELRHPDIEIRVERLMALDSLDMDAADRAVIVAAARRIADEASADAILVTHGTDTLAATAMALDAALAPHRLPILLTGAMRPYRVVDSDACQNVAQAVMAAQLVVPGVYGVMHGRAIAARAIVKDYDRLTLSERST